MPPSEAQIAVEAFKRRLLALESQAAAELVQSYGPIWQRLEADIVRLMEEVMDKQMSIGQVLKMQRLETLQAQVSREMARFSSIANGRITVGQRDAIRLSIRGARDTIDAALPVGIDTRMLARAGIEWNRLPAEALEALAGIAGDGAPLSNLLNPLGNEARAGIIQGLAEGIALGKSPRETAALIRARFGMPLTRALAISRTETLRAYREATRLQYQANTGIVKGYRRLAAKDSRVCMACIALDGTFYRLDQPLDEHVNGRCALVPETIGYRDLGLNVPDDDTQPETAGEWFAQQPEAVQREMMGDAQFEAWQDGKVGLDDLVQVQHSSVWGDSATVKPLSKLL